jgi:hypothetical protein
VFLYRPFPAGFRNASTLPRSSIDFTEWRRGGVARNTIKIPVKTKNIRYIRTHLFPLHLME